MIWAWYEDAKDDWREAAELLLWKSDISGKVLSGGTKTIEQDPLLDWLLLLSMDGMDRAGGRARHRSRIRYENWRMKRIPIQINKMLVKTQE